ncbi:MAG TPA: hypothetical protein VEA69_00415 [Tepidisphaeraceae bacterium]|nr:hypothetical protein [Tepidisphaeraceae bacterium]
MDPKNCKRAGYCVYALGATKCSICGRPRYAERPAEKKAKAEGRR